MIVYTEGRDEAEVAEAADEEGKKLLPTLSNLEPLDLLGLFPEQHFTQPPPRFTEATLISALEEAGMAENPAPTRPPCPTIQDRGYVERIGEGAGSSQRKWLHDQRPAGEALPQRS